MFALAWATAARAQTVAAENGFQPNRDYLALQPFEAIDTASGNLVLTFTDLSLPCNGGRSLSFTRAFNNTTFPPGGQWWFSISGLPLLVQERGLPAVGTPITQLDTERMWSPTFYLADGSALVMTFMNDPDTSSQSQIQGTMRWLSAPNF